MSALRPAEIAAPAAAPCPDPITHPTHFRAWLLAEQPGMLPTEVVVTLFRLAATVRHALSQTTP